MTLEEEGAYIRLLSICWREGSIPSDLSLLSRLCKGGSTKVLTVVQGRFKRDPNDASRMIHPRLEIEREKQALWRAKSSQGGKNSAIKRSPSTGKSNEGWLNHTASGTVKGGSTLQSSVCSLQSSNKKSRGVFIPPTTEEAQEEAGRVGIPKAEGEKFFNYYSSKGWLVGKSKMVSWKAAMATWKTNHAKFNSSASLSILDAP